METAHDLARYAAMCADYIDLEQIESFATQHDFSQEWTRVTFRLTNGTSRTYAVREVDDEPGLSASLSPDSPPR